MHATHCNSLLPCPTDNQEIQGSAIRMNQPHGSNTEDGAHTCGLHQSDLSCSYETVPAPCMHSLEPSLFCSSPLPTVQASWPRPFSCEPLDPAPHPSLREALHIALPQCSIAMLHQSIAGDATKSSQCLTADWIQVISTLLWILLLTVTLQHCL